jgi:integrase
MGSIVTVEKADKVSGKKVVRYRAFIRRKGYAATSATFDTKTEAKEWLRNNEGDGKLIRASAGGNFADLVEAFMKAPVTDGTKWRTPSQLDFWLQKFGNMKVGKIGRADINLALASLQVKNAHHRSIDGTITETDRLITPATVNRYRATLSSVFNYALDHAIVEVNPLRGGKIGKLTESKGRRRILSKEEEQRLYAAADESGWQMMRLFIRMCFTTAARKSEVLRLRWRDINLEDSVAIVPKTKNGDPRALPLVDDVRASLRLAEKIKPLQSDYVFFDPKKPERPKSIDTTWRFVRERAGLFQDQDDPLDQVVLHSTRHTGATRLIKGGANIAQVAAVTGHKSLSQLKRYTHFDTQDSVDLAQRFLSGDKENTAA